MERLKGFVVLKDPDKAGPKMEKRLIDFCRQDLILWNCSQEIEFRRQLPLTLVGKVAFAELTAEEKAKRGGEDDFCRE